MAINFSKYYQIAHLYQHVFGGAVGGILFNNGGITVSVTVIIFGSGFLKFDGGGGNVVSLLFGGLKMSSVVIGSGLVV